MTGDVPAALDPSDDEVVCRECDGVFAQITSSHLSRHGMTMSEYRDEHPDAPVQSESVRERGGWDESAHGGDTRQKISEAISEKHERGDYDADA